MTSLTQGRLWLCRLAGMPTGLPPASHAATADLQAAQELNSLDQVEQALEALLETRQELLPLLQQGNQGCGGRIRWDCGILAASGRYTRQIWICKATFCQSVCLA